MDLSEKDSKPTAYGRFESNGKPASVIRTLDGHCVPTRMPREEPDLDVDYLANVYEDD